MEEAPRRCPKCSSQSYTPPTCLICGYNAWVPSGDFRMASERRLGAAFAERDRVLDGEGTEQPMPDEAKTYRCRECEETFPSPQSLAGHVNHHRHEARLKAGAAEAERTVSARTGQKSALTVRPGPPANGGGLACPTCGHGHPASVRVVAEDFAREGVDEELAAKLAAKAYGLLRVPA